MKHQAAVVPRIFNSALYWTE